MSFEESLSRARRLQKKGDNAAALQLYQQILQRNPGNRKAKKALKALQEATSKPNLNRLQNEIRSLLTTYNAGDLDQAYEQARQVARRYPTQPLPFNLVGAILSARGEYRAALPNFAQALKLEPRYGDALANLGNALDQLGRWEEAAQVYRQYIGVDGESADATIRLGRCLGKINRRSAAVECFQRALVLDPASVPARLEIGAALSSAHRFGEAAIWFREALQFDDQSATAQMGLSRALLQMEKWDEAIDALQRSLELAPGNSEATHLLNAAREIDSDGAPAGYVSRLFDNYAPTFEHHLTRDLGYQGPKELLALLEETLPADMPFSRMVDLGSGPGIGGVVFRERCESMTAIDLSPLMLEQAGEKGCYAELIHGDAVSVLQESSRDYDLFLCADTVVYIGNLAPMARAVASAAAPGALLCLSTEDYSGPGFKLLKTGRYTHSRDYVESTLQDCDFELLAFRQAPLRKEQRDWLQGGFYLFRYAAQAPGQ